MDCSHGFDTSHDHNAARRGVISGWCLDTSTLSEPGIFQMHGLFLNLELFRALRVRRANPRSLGRPSFTLQPWGHTGHSPLALGRSCPGTAACAGRLGTVRSHRGLGRARHTGAAPWPAAPDHKNHKKQQNPAPRGAQCPRRPLHSITNFSSCLASYITAAAPQPGRGAAPERRAQAVWTLHWSHCPQTPSADPSPPVLSENQKTRES